MFTLKHQSALRHLVTPWS